MPSRLVHLIYKPFCRIWYIVRNIYIYNILRSMYIYNHFYFPARLVGGLTLNDLLDKPWSQVSCLLPPGTCLHFYRAWGSAFPLLVDFHRMLPTHSSRAFRSSILTHGKSRRTCALGDNWNRENDFSRHVDNLPSHRGRDTWYWVYHY